MICKKCGESVSDGAAFCINCGEKVEKESQNSETFCPVCGHSNPDKTVFCRNCGNQILATPATVQPAQPSYQASGNPSVVIAEVKRLCGSLALVLMFTISTVLEIFNSVNGSLLTGIMYELGLGKYANLFGESYFSVIISKTPLILIVIGMWITFASSKNHYQRSVSTGGLTLIKVIAVIFAIVSAIEYFLLLIIVGEASNSAYGYYDTIDDAIVIAILVIILLGIVFTSYYIAMFNTAGAISSAAKYGRITNMPSIYLAVCSYIIGIGKFIVLLITARGQTALNAIAVLCSTTAYIMLGVFITNFRSRLKELTTPAPLVASAGQNQPNSVYPPNPSYIPPYQTYTPVAQPQQIQPQIEADKPKTVICTSCGAEIPSGSAFCGKCGGKVVVNKNKICPKCGSSVPYDDVFCNNCGERLNQQQEEKDEVH